MTSALHLYKPLNRYIVHHQLLLIKLPFHQKRGGDILMLKGTKGLVFTLVLLLGSSLVYGNVDYTKDPMPEAPETQSEGAEDKSLCEGEVSLIQKFIDSSNAVLYLKDEQGRFLMVNRRVAEMLKVSK
jgi:PAS domain-containing protein